GSPGAHLGVSVLNPRAQGFYRRLGFQDLVVAGEGAERCIYMGISLTDRMPGPVSNGRER
ncbi:MAG: hypothetical protein ABI603_07430, partial [Acidobacteriota bacterium]